MAEPDRFVEPDPELPLALLDQKEVSTVPPYYQRYVQSRDMYALYLYSKLYLDYIYESHPSKVLKSASRLQSPEH